MLNRLHALPRDTRDTLFLLGVIAWVVLPQVPNLPVWCVALAATMLTWRGWLAWQARPLPGRWWLLALLVVTIAATVATHRTVLGRDAGVTLIVVLLALKTLELRARRDAFVIFFLGFFTMLTNFFFSQSLLTAAAMLVALLGLLAAVVNAHMPVGRPPLIRSIRVAGRMALLGAPIMAVLFALFPRLAPLWGIPGDALTGRSGLSASMQVGTIAKLALDETIAMRLRFDGPPPAQSDLYFRGPVLSRFDGREWQPRRDEPWRYGPDSPAAGLRLQGPAVRYEVTLEPSSRPWIFLLEAASQPPQLPGGLVATQTRDLQWMVSRPVTDILRYRGESHPQFAYGPVASDRASQPRLLDELELPSGFNPRTLQLALDIRREAAAAGDNPAAIVRRVLDRLRTGGYTYTLEPGVTGIHSADEFWFDTRAGFCEHIASAFVILMRALDIPARVVTGYQGGQINPVDGYWTIRQSDAHAWAEVWLAGQGWVRVDPTSAVAPGRTGAFERLVAPQGVIGGAIATLSPGLAQQLRATWEAVNNRWNQWVLNYSQSRQLDLLRNIGFESPSWQDLGKVLAGLLALAALVGVVWARWERSRHDPWLRLLARASAQLRKSGLSLPPQCPPREIARRLTPRADAGTTATADAVAPIDAQRAAVWATWLDRMDRYRYAPATPHRERLSALEQAFRQLPRLTP